MAVVHLGNDRIEHPDQIGAEQIGSVRTGPLARGRSAADRITLALSDAAHGRAGTALSDHHLGDLRAVNFKVLSHAGLHVEHRGCSVVIDPWIVGSAYWRSWWNFPEADVDPQSFRPNYLYLTHIHWDHFHGPSLRKFPRDTPVLVPRDRYDRMKRDLLSLDFTNVQEIPHGRAYRIADDFFLTPYLFGLFTDSAVVLSSGNATLLNANDCKIVGGPLTRLLQDHPKIDFVFRSHSSANARLCHEYLDSPNARLDDRERYMRSFCNFIKATGPRYAVPFASNHCHLHKDTLRFNDWIVSPIDVANYYDKYRQDHHLSTELKVMLPGSRWDEVRGFALADPTVFEDRSKVIAEYQQRNESKLTAYYAKEARTTLSNREMEAFFSPFFDKLGWLLRLPFRHRPVYLRSSSASGRQNWKVDVWRKTIAPCEDTEFEGGSMQVTYPAIVLKQCLAMNMFSHAGISKRAQYKADRHHMRLLLVFEHYLKMSEYDYLPLRTAFSRRSFKNWLDRLREVMLYAQVCYLHFVKRHRMTDIEQELLGGA